VAKNSQSKITLQKMFSVKAANYQANEAMLYNADAYLKKHIN
jgi:hypothetical protein